MTETKATTEPEPTPKPIPRLWAWLFLGLLILPFDPHWIDFEQVRRAQMLVLTGLLAVIHPTLPRVRGEAAWLTFLGFLAVAALISARSLQPWEALYRFAHFAALLYVLRLGAALPRAFGTPIAALLSITSLYGLVQRAGYGEIAGYGRTVEPVSVFGNLNVASEWTAVALLAVLVLPVRRTALRHAAVALAGAYLVVDGSRGGMIAAGIGLLVLVLRRRTLSAMLGPAFAVLGAGLGLGLSLALPTVPEPDLDARIAQEQRASATIAVRYEIARGCTGLIAERPLFGWGPGQFQVQYPRVRTEEEIELSSHGRRFRSEVRTAHDDWLELLVEGGLPLVLAFAAALFALQRGHRDKLRLLPLLVLLVLMLVRSPLGNAPALAVALLPIADTRPGGPISGRLRWLRRTVGLGLLVLGILPLVAHLAFAPYVAQKARGEVPDMRAAMLAHRWMPWEPRWLEVLAREHLIQDNLPAARKAAAMAVRLRPHSPSLLLLLAETLSRGNDYELAAEVAGQALAIDPRDPELRVLHSTALMLSGRYDDAVRTVYEATHPLLRERLPRHFRSLAKACMERGDRKGFARCRVELLFLEVIETIDTDDLSERARLNARLEALNTAVQDAGTRKSDLRPFALYALQFLALDQTEPAERLGQRAAELGLTMPAWQRRWFGDRLAPLRALPVWNRILGPTS